MPNKRNESVMERRRLGIPCAFLIIAIFLFIAVVFRRVEVLEMSMSDLSIRRYSAIECYPFNTIYCIRGIETTEEGFLDSSADYEGEIRFLEVSRKSQGNTTVRGIVAPLASRLFRTICGRNLREWTEQEPVEARIFWLQVRSLLRNGDVESAIVEVQRQCGLIIHNRDGKQSPSTDKPKKFASDDRSDFPLLQAVLNQDKDSFDALLKEGDDPNAWDNRGNNAVSAAAGIPNSQYWLHTLIHNGGDPRASVPEGGDLTPKWLIGFTPLHSAVGADENILNIRILVEANVDIDAKNANGMTPLGLATGSRHYDAAEYLIDNGADVSAKAIDGGTIREFLEFIISDDYPLALKDEDTKTVQRILKRLQSLE